MLLLSHSMMLFCPLLTGSWNFLSVVMTFRKQQESPSTLPRSNHFKSLWLSHTLPISMKIYPTDFHYLTVILALAIFNPHRVPGGDSPRLSCYGTESVKTLLEHYGQDKPAETVLGEETVKPALKFKQSGKPFVPC